MMQDTTRYVKSAGKKESIDVVADLGT